ncbi:MAG: enoyl-CoA hydratase/isomerase family protein [Proteobacteria bacterium]|nr:enoyl-CoA hydratase/isomerase family protein [Pseudomonadota bacterium]
MEYKCILFEKSNSVAKIIFNRPEASNSLNREMVVEIGHALDEAERDNAVRVLVVTGKGKAFCAGADLKYAKDELSSLWAQQEFFRFANKTVIERIENLSKPVIACVNGFAFAGGYELMLACDLAVAAESAMIADQHINYGLVGPGGSTQRTTWLVGPRMAKDIILTGKRISGKEAQRIGLVNYAVAPDELESFVAKLASQLAEKSPAALRIAKSLINRALQINMSLAAELEVMSAIVNATSEDYSEGITAFNEKRKPIFKGR